MKRTAGVAWIEKNALAVGQIFRQILGQVFVAHCRRGDNDQIHVLHDRREMRAHEVRCRGFLCAALGQFDFSASPGELRDSAFRSREQADLKSAQSEIRGGGAAAVAGAKDSDFAN